MRTSRSSRAARTSTPFGATGMRVIGEDGDEVVARTRGVRQDGDAGPQDVVLLAVKAHQVAPIAARSRTHLCHDDDDDRHDAERDSVVVLPQTRRAYDGTRRSRRPIPTDRSRDASIANRVIGSVVYPAAVLEAPGVVHVVEGRRFTLGELDGSTSPRAQAISAAFTRAGFKAPIIGDIRGEIWLKIWGNLSFNPISALTHATLVDLLQFPLTRQLSIDMMREAEAVADKLGVTFRVGIDKRIAGAEKVGAHKTSMLQDVEAGTPIEIEALVGAVVELGRLTETPTPHIDAVYALRESAREDARRSARQTRIDRHRRTTTAHQVQTACAERFQIY